MADRQAGEPGPCCAAWPERCSSRGCRSCRRGPGCRCSALYCAGGTGAKRAFATPGSASSTHRQAMRREAMGLGGWNGLLPKRSFHSSSQCRKSGPYFHQEALALPSLHSFHWQPIDPTLPLSGRGRVPLRGVKPEARQAHCRDGLAAPHACGHCLCAAPAA